MDSYVLHLCRECLGCQIYVVKLDDTLQIDVISNLIFITVTFSASRQRVEIIQLELYYVITFQSSPSIVDAHLIQVGCN